MSVEPLTNFAKRKAVNNTGVITISSNTIKQNEVQIKVAKDSPIGQSVILAPEDI